jgi:hypothetical protein
MQDLVLQYLKKTVLRPRAVGRSKFLGGKAINSSVSFEGKGFAFIPGILSGMEGQLPLRPDPMALSPYYTGFSYYVVQ